jgi:hypothetical protein
MIYFLPLVCSILLGGIFIFTAGPSGGSKLLVAALVIASLVMQFLLPVLWLVALLIQVILSIGILLYLKIH